jgi:hypothetical protein
MLNGLPKSGTRRLPKGMHMSFIEQASSLEVIEPGESKALWKRLGISNA